MNETENLLSNSQNVDYGSVREDETTQLDDQEDVRKERAVLEYITARATNNMIDIAHPVTAGYGNNQGMHVSGTSGTGQTSDITFGDSEDEEDVWLESLKVDASGSLSHFNGLHTGDLVMDVGQLRPDVSVSSSRIGL
ncbi:hypothetical protein LTR62_003590 [Meristemomyces frigidus]|uniref:Uncharacterized protein n=1 Tax=Meristemomyces frigidus TaxID=1508187 RepID=A0AAN7YKJ9_9PEZI|nr:hypothetical protein LTR62_003590 [Meristemomyces frigidus]